MTPEPPANDESADDMADESGDSAVGDAEAPAGGIVDDVVDDADDDAGELVADLDDHDGAGEDLAPLIGTGAPPVVAVMITHDPGDWFEETLESVAAQDYGSLSVLVLDNASATDPTERIADPLPTAFVKRLDQDRGFSAAANEALAAVQGAAFYLFLHDDVRLEPDAVTRMVAEAFRSTAGIVGPKLLDWDDPDRLDSVGYSVDPYGFRSSIADPGELDQAQHDFAREVFAVSDAVMLVRADLFESLGGFTESIPYFGEDVDLCWRAHIAGATVYVSPNATAGHRNRFGERRDVEDRGRLELRHEARTMLTNYSALRLLQVMPVVLLLSVVDFLGSIVLGRFQRAGDILSAWAWNVGHLPSLLRARSRAKSERRVPDSEYLPLMRQGSSRMSSLVRVDGEDEGRLQAAAQAGRGYFQQLGTSSNRSGAVLSLIAALVTVIGARGLIAGYLPSLREFSSFGTSATDLLSEWFAAWREPGFGESAVPPASIPGTGLLSLLLLGSAAAARRLVIVAPLFIGALGAWKLFASTRSSRARAGALVAYGLNPIALNAMAEGRLQALIAYAMAPWILRRLATGAGLTPFSDDAAPVQRRQVAAPPRRSAVRHSAGTALQLVVVGAFSPIGAAVLVAALLVVAVVQIATGARAGGTRMAALTALSSFFAALVLSPWLVAAVVGGDAATLTNLWHSAASTPSASSILTGSTGPIVTGAFGWGILLAAGYALLNGRSWRVRWALSGWVVAFISWGVSILLARTGLIAGVGLELFLVPAALGLTVAVAMGAFAFEEDVVGSDFGLPQFLSAVAVVALLLGVVPVMVAAGQGRWYLPDGDFDRSLAAVDDGSQFRTLWLGDPDLLPLAGWELGSVDGVAFGTSQGLSPTISSQYRLDGGPGVAELRSALDAALHGETARLGRVLAPMGIRYVMVIAGSTPMAFSPIEAEPPSGAVPALREQLDLVEFETDPAITAFRVAEPWPLRSDITDLPAELTGSDTWIGLTRVASPAPPAVLDEGTGVNATGVLQADRSIARAGTAAAGWTLTAGGEPAEISPLMGWQQQYRTEAAGDATLSWSTPIASRALQLLQLVMVVALVTLAGGRRRSSAGSSRRRAAAGRGEDPLVVVTEAEPAAPDLESSVGSPKGDSK